MDERNEIKLTGVMSQGYGIIPKAVMRDPSLSAESKAIYCYLRSFAGAGNTAFPSRELICHEMNISKNRFNKYKNELIQKGFLMITRKRTENGFSRNIYEFNETVCPQFVDLQNEDIRFVDLQSLDLQNEDTNSNSLNSNSLNNKSNELKPVKDDLKERFELLWKPYPNKKGKDGAFKAYKRAIKDGVTDEAILSGIERYKQEIAIKQTEPQFIQYGSTWFNGKRWEDDYITAEAKQSNQTWEQDWSVPEQNKVRLDDVPEINLDDLPF